MRYAPDTGYTGSAPFTYTVSGGNGRTDTATVTVTVSDTKAPEAPLITSPANNSFDNDGSFSASGTAEAGAKVELFEGEISKGEAPLFTNILEAVFFEAREIQSQEVRSVLVPDFYKRL